MVVLAGGPIALDGPLNDEPLAKTQLGGATVIGREERAGTTPASTTPSGKRSA